MSTKLLEVRLFVNTTSDGFPAQGYTSVIVTFYTTVLPVSGIIWNIVWIPERYRCRWAGRWQGNQLMLAINEVIVLHFVW